MSIMSSSFVDPDQLDALLFFSPQKEKYDRVGTDAQFDNSFHFHVFVTDISPQYSIQSFNKYMKPQYSGVFFLKMHDDMLRELTYVLFSLTV